MALVSLENLTRFYAKLKEKDLITLNQVYPVGSIYLSVNSTNPATLFGGTWEQLKDRFLLGCSSTYSNGSTGGSATNSHTHSVTTSGTVGSHTLTVNEIPSHTHDALVRWSEGGGGSAKISAGYEWGDAYAACPTTATGGSAGHSHGFSGSTVTSGGASNTNNMPPYLAVYM